MDNQFEIVLLGGGGHARVLIDSLRQSGDLRSIAVLDADTSLHGNSFFDLPILGGDDLLGQLVQNGTRYFIIGFAGTKDHEPRKRAYENACALGLHPLSVRHPSAIISPHATIGLGSQVMAGAIVNASARLGANVILNTASVVEHDCTVGNHVHIASGARLCGGVHVADLAHVGAGSTILQGVSIGYAAVVGLGASVIADVANLTTVFGVPAKPKSLPTSSENIT